MPDAITLPRQLEEYVRRVSIRESDVQRRLRELTLGRADASMLTSPEQAHFLAFLATILGARRCLEIGVYTGYTSICLAQALPPDGRVIGCDVSDESAAIAKRYWREAGVDHKIELRMGPASETLDALIDGGEAGRFDFVYIDADKGGYPDYYERSLILVRPGGVIAADNVLRTGRVVAPSVDDVEARAMDAFNRRLANDDRIALTLLPIRDGLTLAMRRAS